MDTIHFTDQAKFDRLINLKRQLQNLEVEAKLLQVELLRKYPDLDSYSNFDGTLTKVEKKQFSPPNNDDFIKAIDQATFNRVATLSVSNIRKVGGDMLLTKLLNVPGTPFKKKEPSVYYMFKIAK